MSVTVSISEPKLAAKFIKEILAEVDRRKGVLHVRPFVSFTEERGYQVTLRLNLVEVKVPPEEDDLFQTEEVLVDGFQWFEKLKALSKKTNIQVLGPYTLDTFYRWVSILRDPERSAVRWRSPGGFFWDLSRSEVEHGSRCRLSARDPDTRCEMHFNAELNFSISPLTLERFSFIGETHEAVSYLDGDSWGRLLNKIRDELPKAIHHLTGG